MTYFDRIDVLKELMLIKQVHHYLYLLNYSFRHLVHIRCHDLLTMSINLSDIAILSIKGFDYRCIISYKLNYLLTINLIQKTYCHI